ncbi:Lariat debranching enzyme [Lecanosticta acicola]|uniref:Lariat debranching enzyme n=1 Tax=Lecanosticta acicola TaxID=111012 RepID=A0AAI8Z9H5_9PEZI|nr:Lariat debranching enzyme [Lecanosticta acicola]
MACKLEESQGVRLAIEGCGHGTLHAIYASIQEACKQKGWPGVDLLIIGGDFQSVRNAYDLNCVSMPAKYREMCDFHEYYSGQRVAPYLTVFVGGNHEASNYLSELYYGGWVAANIYYMGATNVLQLGPLRIAGLSGIWKGFDYRKPHFERLPYNESEMKSIYHVRELDVRKLLQIRTQVDIGVSHDWPQGVEWKGNFKQLFKSKRYFEDDARSGKLGSVAAKNVLDRLRPPYWFSAHLHCKYAATVAHGDERAPQKPLPNPSGGATSKKDENEIDLDEDGDGTAESIAAISKNHDEIDLDLDDDDDAERPTEAALGLNTTPAAAVTTAPANVDEIHLELDDDTPTHTNGANDKEAPSPLDQARAALPASFAKPKSPEPIEHPPDITNTTTNFLALDKCLPHKDFLQLLSIPSSETDLDHQRPLRLSYDPEWLAITRAFTLAEPPTFGGDDPASSSSSSSSSSSAVPPAKSQSEYKSLVDEQMRWIDAHLNSRESLVIPENFAITAPVYDGGHFQNPQYQTVREFPNPQTRAFCEMLRMPNPLEMSEEELEGRMARGPKPEPEGHFGGARGRGRGRGGGFGRGGRGGRGRGGFGGGRGGRGNGFRGRGRGGGRG